ncbi:hypothetical protein [uncultured Intestinimonas sp.]|uniref:hypothetical protein n=1 Tax=uncultured Intestinimonas sp. TaxID=1689265 RepID=UPI002942A352|nr:hypothetical protein [uncultured Intestinimonas sp.]
MNLAGKENSAGALQTLFQNLWKALKDLGAQSREPIVRELTIEESSKVYDISKAAVSKRLKTF